MKVLMVHNFYRSSAPSGEDFVFKAEMEMLKKNGIEVINYTRTNDEFDDIDLSKKFLVPFDMIWSRRTYTEMKRLIRLERPDIVHFHNIWYRISPSAYYACKDMGVPIVQTIHNFRMFCSNGLLFRNDKVCEECLSEEQSKFLLMKNSVKYKCYKNSRIHSGVVSFIEWYHWKLGTWTNAVDAYIALTEFVKDKLVQEGISERKIYVKPNFLPNPPEPASEEENYILFVGRLSSGKGIEILIETFKRLNLEGIKLKIVGSGPLEDRVRSLVNEKIDFVGRLSRQEVLEVMKRSLFVVVPSMLYETFCLVVVEAFASGKPVVVSNHGSLAEIVMDGYNGLLFKPNDSDDLFEKIIKLTQNNELRRQLGQNALKTFKEKYTEEKNYNILRGIYECVIGS